MLVDEIKKRMMLAMKAHDTVEKEILRTALGEITMGDARGIDSKVDDNVIAVLKKLMKSNEETMSLVQDEEQRKVLVREQEIIRGFLPTGPSQDQILSVLAPVREALCAAKNDGQATGLAVKHLKSVAFVADGKDISEAVRKIRSGTP